ncbi:hypothetical protein INR49_001843 [Caranx melampygus]|nr:hypothetical protein INR49_001843 [Caranx melampygus]
MRELLVLCKEVVILPSRHTAGPGHAPKSAPTPPSVLTGSLCCRRWYFGLAPPPPGAGVRSQQPVVPCAPPSPSLHTRAHAQGGGAVRSPGAMCLPHTNNMDSKLQGRGRGEGLHFDHEEEVFRWSPSYTRWGVTPV